jgi:DNA-binding GntR family transcriptional regulator
MPPHRPTGLTSDNIDPADQAHTPDEPDIPAEADIPDDAEPMREATDAELDEIERERAARQAAPSQTIAADLRAAIAEGRYPHGAALPSEPELARIYQVSRPTVRKAIDALVSEGLVYVLRGRGSFVRPLPQRRLILLTTDRDRHDLAAPRYHPGIRRYGFDLALRDQAPPFSSEVTPADFTTALMLSVRPGHPVIHRQSLWSYDHGARIAIDSYTDADLVPDWNDNKRHHQYRKRAGFFYTQLQRGHAPVRWMTVTTARQAQHDERALLHMDHPDPVIEITRFMTDQHGRTLEATRITAPADKFEIAQQAEIHPDPSVLDDTDDIGGINDTLTI